MEKPPEIARVFLRVMFVGFEATGFGRTIVGTLLKMSGLELRFMGENDFPSLRVPYEKWRVFLRICSVVLSEPVEPFPDEPFDVAASGDDEEELFVLDDDFETEQF